MKQFWAPWAWIDGQWQADVLLTVGGDGYWQKIETGIAKNDPIASGAEHINGQVLPGMVNAHSHAFQRAMAGLAEVAPASGGDDFWAWRDRMYQVAQRISARQLEVVATQLYGEMLRAGYTQVCEFHYLHHSLPTDAQDAMLQSLVNAAQTVGIGLTVLPTLYSRAGFTATGLRPDQARFRSTVPMILDWMNQVRGLQNPLVNCGAAIHSLRAAPPAAIEQLVNDLSQAVHSKAPIHIHVSEQMQEVRECIEHLGDRPIAWLAKQGYLNNQWNLVHATHASEDELRAAHAAGAAVVLCPSTEANLGDGIFDFSIWHDLGGAWNIGSDSHVCRSVAEELRWLEYGQRLQRQCRIVAAGPGQSVGQSLWQASSRGGEQACGLRVGRIEVNYRADLLVLADDAVMAGALKPSQWLDHWLFAGVADRPQQTMVAGRWVGSDREQIEKLAQNFKQAMHELWA